MKLRDTALVLAALLSACDPIVHSEPFAEGKEFVESVSCVYRTHVVCLPDIDLNISCNLENEYGRRMERVFIQTFVDYRKSDTDMLRGELRDHRSHVRYETDCKP